MKYFAAITSMFFLIGANMAVADEQSRNDTEAGFVMGTATAGALIGGPIGFVVGTGIGAWLSNKVVKSYEVDALVAQLDQARAKNVVLANQLASTQRDSTRYAQFAADSLQFQVMFLTGEARLEPGSTERMTELAEFLTTQPDIRVALSGYADPRGDDSYNMQLSQQRIDSIEMLLQANGIDDQRITSSAFGDRQSTADEGNLDAYALERRVTIELLPAMHEAKLAAVEQQ